MKSEATQTGVLIYSKKKYLGAYQVLDKKVPFLTTNNIRKFVRTTGFRENLKSIYSLISHYNPLVSFTHRLCCAWVLILYISGGVYRLKSTPNYRILETFYGNFFTLRVFDRNLLRGSCQKTTILSYCYVFTF